MVKLTNIRTELSKKFLLKTRKEEVWSNYLKDEAQYVNGSVYVHKTQTPKYHKQTITNKTFNTNNTTTTNCTIHINKTENITQDQLNKTVLYLNNNNVYYTKTLTENGITITIPNTVNGNLNVIIPSINTSTDEYSGLQINIPLQNQTINITNSSITSNAINLQISISNFVSGQTIKLSTVFRDGDTDATISKVLTSNDKNGFNMNITRSTQNTGYRLELVPVTINNTGYLGKLITSSF